MYKCMHAHTYDIYICTEVVQIILYLFKKENPEEQGLKTVLFKKRNSFLLAQAFLLSVGNTGVKGEQNILE